MIILLGFAFFAGVITVLAPCILPILPLILSGASLGGRKRALGIVLGVVLAFSVFTLTLSWLVQHAGFSPNVSRDIGIVLLLALGLLMLIPAWLERFEGWISARVTIQANGQQTGFWGGLILGVSLGAVWTPCAGPILASVTAVTTTGHLTGQAVLVTIFYALGSAIPMALIVLLGQKIITRLAWLKAHGRHIQQFFGIILIIMAGLILTNTDRKVQNAIVRATPNWLSGLQKFEERAPGMPKAQTATNASTDNHTVKLENFGPAPELTGTQGWINSQPLKLSDLRGKVVKVVLVKFWTFSCIIDLHLTPSYPTTLIS